MGCRPTRGRMMQPQSVWCSPAYYIRSRTDGSRYTDYQPRRECCDVHLMIGDQGRRLGANAGQRTQQDRWAHLLLGAGSTPLGRFSIVPAEGRRRHRIAGGGARMSACDTVTMVEEWMDD